MSLALDSSPLDPSRPPVGRVLLRCLDQPVREALERGARGGFAVVAPGLVGGALVAVACSLAGVTSTGVVVGMPLGARVLPALLLADGALLVIAMQSRLRTPLGALAASLSIGLLMAGVVAVSVLPLVPFLVAVQGAGTGAETVGTLLMPLVVLGSATVVPRRLLETTEGASTGRGLGWLLALLTFASLVVCL